MKEKVYQVKKKKYEFVPYEGEIPPCANCAFADAPAHACEQYPCRDFERDDNRNGYYRHASSNLITKSVPIGVINGN